MKQYRVCVAEDGKPLSVHVLYDTDSMESEWLNEPDRTTHPETPEETKYVHYLNATDELGAYLRAQEMSQSRKVPKSVKRTI